MRKQITFYIVWDILFAVFLYVYYIVYSWARNTMDYTIIVPTPVILSIMIGAFFAWLIYASNLYQATKKAAVLELIFIGIPAFYAATFNFTVYHLSFFMQKIGKTIIFRNISWLTYSLTPTVICSILFGYELMIFIIRITKCRKKKIIS